MIRIGLIGCGRVAQGHMRVYRQFKDARVVAVSDIDIERARSLSQKYRVPKFFSDYTDLLRMKDLDFVDICSPTSSHVSIACAAAEFGRNVLLEKPMGLSTDECDRIIQESEKHGIRLSVCHNQIFFPSISRAKSLVLSGGADLVSLRTSIKENIEFIDAPAWNLSPDEKGILWEAGYHHAYLQLNFLKEIREVYASGSLVKYPVYDNFAVLLRTPQKAFGLIEVSWLSQSQEAVFEILRADGKRIIIDRTNDCIDEISGGIYSTFSYDVRKALRPFTKYVSSRHLGYFVGHYFLISEYMTGLKNNGPMPVAPSEGKRTVRLLECIEESLKRGKAVTFDNPI